MKVYEIWCEWEMATASGTFSTREKAQNAIDEEEWDDVGHTLESVQEDGMVRIDEIEVG
jgi:hypothetical protein